MSNVEPKTIFGSAIVFFGAGFLLDSVGILNFSGILGTWWPMLIIFIGLLSLASNPSSLAWPALAISAGVLLLLRELGALEFNVWSIILPAILITIGFKIIFESPPGEAHTVNEDESNIFVAFSGIDTKNESRKFIGGKITALFGGVTLDLRDAKIKSSATIDTFVAFGGIELKVPEDWIVHTNGLPLFGGWDNNTRRPAGKRNKKTQVLNVRGSCLFGAVEIKN